MMALGFGDVTSRRLTTTATMYAAVPPNDRGGQHSHRVTGTSQQRAHQITAHDHAPVHRLQAPNNADVIDDTVTSWIPNDVTRHGCHGDDDADDELQPQQLGGADALRMTRLNRDRC